MLPGPGDITLPTESKDAALDFHLSCWLAGHVPDPRYTRSDNGEFISNCARCATLILKPPRRRWIKYPSR
jgi:hypothetical protein